MQTAKNGREELTWDLPVPVAPTMAINGCRGRAGGIVHRCIALGAHELSPWHKRTASSIGLLWEHG